MELSTQIKKYRGELLLSQEELAERVYVSRQTISNWENEKSYPDIHSLILLTNVFEISLDQLIKGDVETMREEIKEMDIKLFNRYGLLQTILFTFMIVSVVPLVWFFKIIGAMIWMLIGATNLIVAIKVEKIKKDLNIQSYREIVAFTEGKRLDELETIKEIAKRPYQKVLLAIGAALITFLVCGIMVIILKWQ